MTCNTYTSQTVIHHRLPYVAEKKEPRKRPRLEDSPIINIQRLPKVIKTKSNGRLHFAPLFEEERKNRMNQFKQVVKIMKDAHEMTTKSREDNKSSRKGNNRQKGGRNKPRPRPKQKLNKVLSSTELLPPFEDFESDRRAKTTTRSPATTSTTTTTTTTARPTPKPKSTAEILGLPELPPQITPSESPVFTLQLKHSSQSNNANGGAHNDFESDDDYDYDNSFPGEGQKWQLLPPKQSSKSIVRFRVDPEQPAQLLLPPPPPPSASKAKQPAAPVNPVSTFQLVGHVMSDDELKSFPDSPIVNISLSSDGQMDTHRLTPSSPSHKLIDKSKNKQDKSGEAATAAVSQPRGHIQRAGKSGGSDFSLPVQLSPPGGGLPGPLVWISPASLARSPMVNLRRLRPNQVHASPPNVERTLTMVFPARQRRRFEKSCLKCLSQGGVCPHCLVVRR